jgi:hypothetical protein
MLFPARPGTHPSSQTLPPRPNSLRVKGTAPEKREFWNAVATLSLGILMAATIAALYTSGLVRMLGVETPLWHTPAILPHVALLCTIFTGAIVWLALPRRNHAAQWAVHLLSGIAPSLAVRRGVRQLRHYRTALKWHQQRV